MRIEEVEEVLGHYRLLRPPEHLFMVREPVLERTDGTAVYKGLQPKGSGRSAVLTPQADTETAIHEVLHANFGLSEKTTYPLAKVLTLKYQVIKKFPVLFSLLKRPVRYEKMEDVPEKFGGKVDHYVLKKL